MNEQIRLLAEQAGFIPRMYTVLGVGEDGYLLTTPKWDTLDPAVGKFANLLIDECAILIREYVDHRIPASQYADLLKKHFEDKNE
jgi:hypothetical protein